MKYPNEEKRRKVFGRNALHSDISDKNIFILKKILAVINIILIFIKVLFLRK